MKYLILLSFAFLLFACSSSKSVYWCGDHACINNKEKDSYFKKTMIVEVRELDKRSNKDQSKLERIKKQSGLEDKNKVEHDKVLNQQSYSEKNKSIKEEKRLKKQIRLEEKRRIKEEKRLTKQIRLEEKRRIKEEKRLKKQIRLEEKRRIKEEKQLEKQIRLEEKRVNKNKISDKKILNTENSSAKEKIAIDGAKAIVDTSSLEFNELVEKITRKNMSKSYPNINDIPN